MSFLKFVADRTHPLPHDFWAWEAPDRHNLIRGLMDQPHLSSPSLVVRFVTGITSESQTVTLFYARKE